MSAPALSDKKQTEEMGVILTRTRRIAFTGTVNIVFPTLQTYIYSVSGGDVVLRNSAAPETNILILAPGEFKFIAFHEILVNANIDGVLETTAAGTYICGFTGQIKE